MTNVRTKLTLLILVATALLSVAQEPAKKIIFNSASRVIRGPYAGNEQSKAGEAQREITAQEFATIDAIHAAGNFAVDDPVGIRVATEDEAAERKTLKQALLGKIMLLALPANRATAYQFAPAILLALENKDKEGAKAIVDLMTTFPPAARTRVKALIDLAPNE